MAETVREVERKYEATDRGALPELAELTGVAGIGSVEDGGVVELDAIYYDTPDLRLAADHLILRRRTGGADAGWHLKLPVGPDTRDEVRAPLSDDVPTPLRGLIRSRSRDARLVPLIRLRSQRTLTYLIDTWGVRLAEVSVDQVTARRLYPGASEEVRWTEMEVELAADGEPAFLDALEPRLRNAGLRPASAASKLARALEETEAGGGPAVDRGTGRPDTGKASTRRMGGAGAGHAVGPELTAGDAVLDYVRHQIARIVELDPAVRLDRADSVHRMRVATRRLRSVFRSYRKVLDRAVTDPLGEELKWLAAELGVDRDREVLTERIDARLAELPDTLLVGPVRDRLDKWSQARRGGSRDQLIAVLDSSRYLDLLKSLNALLVEPPVRPAAARPAAKPVRAAVLRDFDRLAGRMTTALAASEDDRDVALHEARKAAKRVRYAAEAARPVLGRAARRFAKRMTSVQQLLGDHQDSVMAREALRELAAEAHAAGESDFTFGLAYGRERALAAEHEHELPELWAKASRKRHRKALG